ncbi:MAG TPA: cytochrome c oxidase subunit II [Gemmatimonadales bacterium]|nr:cytochrome c oxidase subunit II [Gemmatimonadales bacterium]
MPRTAAWRPARLVTALALLLLVLVGCNPEHYPQTTLLPRGDFARIADDLLDTTVKWALLVFVLVEGVLIYAIFRFRGKPGDPEPHQTHGNTTVEIIWTVIPALILAAIAVPTVRAIFQTNATPGGDALTIEVVGHQWWWEFRYPEYNLTTANEIHVPVGRTVSLRMGSADVIHSFWVPQFAAKRDVFANRESRMWFKAETAGDYPAQCAEFCGIQHGRMAYRIKAQNPAEFDAWVAHMRTLGPKPAAGQAQGTAGSRSEAVVRTASEGASLQQPGQQGGRQSAQYAAGEKLFTSKGCIACHSLQAVNAPKGMVGPNLANIGARSYIAAGTLKNTDANLARWIRDPQGIKKGVLMPNMGINEADAQALVAFLRAHK